MHYLNSHEFQIADEKCRYIGSRLNLNILYQMLLIFIGISTFVKPDFLKDNVIFGIRFSESLAHIIVPLFLLYLFIRMGYMFWTYHNTRLVIDREINKMDSNAEMIQRRYTIYSHNDVAELVYLFFKSTELRNLGIEGDKANPIPIGKSDFSITFWFVYIVVLFFSWNHAIMFIFIFDFFSIVLIKWVFLFSSITIVLACYYEFYRMTKLKDNEINAKNKASTKSGISKYFFRLLILEPILTSIWIICYYTGVLNYLYNLNFN